MLTLRVRQCPRCVLRFGSSSELEQHLRLDHRPATTSPQSEPPAARASAPLVSTDLPLPEPRNDIRPFLLRTVLAGSLVALVAVLSWHVAVLMSAVLVAVVAARAAETAAEKDRR
jgi:hypothetical protein